MRNFIFYSILITLMCFFQKPLFAQTYVKLKLVGLGVEGIDNDDTVTITGYNLPQNSNFFLSSAAGLFNSNDTVNNFHVYQDLSTFFWGDQTALIKNENYDTLIASSTITYPKFNFDVTAYIPPSSIYSQDGEITLFFDSIVDIANLKVYAACAYPSLPFSPIYLPGTTIQVLKPIIPITSDGHTFTFKNVRLGPFTIEIIDGDLITDHFRTTIYIGDPDEEIIYNCGVPGYLVHRLISTPTCNSILIIEPMQYYQEEVPYTVNYTITGPSASEFYYSSSNQSISSNILCPGLYKIRMESTDISGIGGYQDYEFVQIDPTQTYFDISLLNSYQDSVGLHFKNCDFDFNTPISSINFDYEILGQFQFQGNVYSIHLEVLQGSQVTHFYDTLIFSNIEDYKIVVGIYCDEPRSDGDFALKGLAFIPNETMSTSTLQKEIFRFSPNPASSYIQFTENQKGQIIDYSGRLCKEFDGTIIDVSSLQNGVYFLRVEKSLITEKFIIER